MKALVGAFNQEKALVGAFSVIVQLVVEPMDSVTALFTIFIPEWGSSADDFRLLPDGGGHIQTPEEAVMFDTFLPEIFAVIPLVKVELNNVLVVTLQNY